MKKTYTISILFIAILVSVLFLAPFKESSLNSENFTNCEKKVYSIERQIRVAVEMNHEHKVKGLEVALKRVNKRCKSIL